MDVKARLAEQRAWKASIWGPVGYRPSPETCAPPRGGPAKVRAYAGGGCASRGTRCGPFVPCDRGHTHLHGQECRDCGLFYCTAHFDDHRLEDDLWEEEREREDAMWAAVERADAQDVGASAPRGGGP